MRTKIELSSRLQITLIGVAALLVAACSSTPAPAPAEPAEPAKVDAPTSVEISDTRDIAATVTALDRSTRVVTVRGPEGNETSFQAGPQVRNLDQVSVGDTIRLSYVQQYVATRLGADEMSSDVKVGVGSGRAAQGERPGALVGARASMTVQIESIGPEGRSVTFKRPDGQLHSLQPQREEGRAFARSLQPGDVVELTYREALAMMVEPLAADSAE